MRDNKRNANNAGIGNKLVTIFARHLDSFIMTINLSLIYQFFPVLDKSCNRDNIIVRRDWQKLRPRFRFAPAGQAPPPPHSAALAKECLAPGQLYGSPAGEYQDPSLSLSR
jgi:hypothetical protein